jgi:hypothetical protein
MEWFQSLKGRTQNADHMDEYGNQERNENLWTVHSFRQQEKHDK